jgi:hypothetical protein
MPAGAVARARARPHACGCSCSRNWAAPRPPCSSGRSTTSSGWPYRPDPEAYGERDHWATPLEFLQHSGDCEDYAAIKYVSLRRLGFRPDRLRLVVVRDTARKIAHAVLLARLDQGWQVLDNLSDRILPPDRIDHYRPYYSVNEEMRWSHLQPARPGDASSPSGADERD